MAKLTTTSSHFFKDDSKAQAAPSFFKKIKSFCKDDFRFFTIILYALTIFALASVDSYAFVSIRTNSGTVTKIPNNNTITIRSNEQHNGSITSGEIFSILTTSLNRWKQLSTNAFNFLYYQGSDTNLYPNSVGGSSDSQVFFTSHADGNQQLNCGVIAVTQIYFDGSGNISKFDQRYNDNCFQFSANPASTGNGNLIYFGDVATHELGHALGLDHSQNLQSSMIYTAYSEMSRPSCDDEAAMRHLYTSNNQMGSITGQILSPQGSPIFGAHVNIISLERGVAVTSALTDQQGYFTSYSLEPGNYTVVVEPFYPGSGALGLYYSSIQSTVCNGNKFERSFYSSNGKLLSTQVNASSTSNIGTLTVNCQPQSSINSFNEQSAVTAPILATNDIVTPISSVSKFVNVNTHYYKLKNVSGHIEVHALAYSLFSPIDVDVELFNSNGTPIAQSHNDDVYSGQNNSYVNRDAQSLADITSSQDIYIKVTNKNYVNSSLYPSGPVSVSANPFYVITVSRGQSNAIYAENARCVQTDQFSSYSNLGDAPFSTNGSGSFTSTSSGCGQIVNTNHDFNDQGNIFRLINFISVITFLISFRFATKRKLFPSLR